MIVLRPLSFLILDVKHRGEVTDFGCVVCGEGRLLTGVNVVAIYTHMQLLVNTLVYFLGTRIGFLI